MKQKADIEKEIESIILNNKPQNNPLNAFLIYCKVLLEHFWDSNADKQVDWF